MLTKFELANELPSFIHAELVDIGEGFPFYEDFMKGSSEALVTPESRMKTQLCVIADFVQHQGDLLLLRTLWSRIGSFTNYQAMFCDFDWSEERISVSTFIFKTGGVFFVMLVITHLFPFQSIFQHIFNCALEDVGDHVTSEQCFGLEFVSTGNYRFMYLRFWKAAKLCRVFICRSALPTTSLNGDFGSLARLLSAISLKADIVCCSGSSVDLIRTLNHSQYFAKGVLRCFRFESLNLRNLMHKSSYSVFGRIDFFSVIQCLMVSLGGALSEDWVVQSPELSRVSVFSSFSFCRLGIFPPVSGTFCYL